MASSAYSGQSLAFCFAERFCRICRISFGNGGKYFLYSKCDSLTRAGILLQQITGIDIFKEEHLTLRPMICKNCYKKLDAMSTKRKDLNDSIADMVQKVVSGRPFFTGKRSHIPISPRMTENSPCRSPAAKRLSSPDSSSRQRGIQRSIRFGSETQVNVVGISPLEAGTNLAHPISMCTTVTTTASISTQTSVTSTASISTQTSVTATASRSTTYTQTVSRVSNKKV